MTVKIHVKGAIIGNDLKEVYNYYGMESTCPKDIADSLPNNQEQIEVIINSGGGHIDAGSEIYFLLKDYKGKVTVKIAGMAASAASVIAMAGDHIIIVPTAQMMIHNVSSIAVGDYQTMLHESDVLKEMNRSIANAYILKTGKPEKDILELMNKETWLSAKTALEQGFVDEIMGVSSENLAEFLVASSHTSNLLPASVIEKYREIKVGNNTKGEQPSNQKKNIAMLFI